MNNQAKIIYGKPI